MPLSLSEKNALANTAQSILDEVNALVVDPAVNPLQPQLDAANATIAANATEKAAMQARIDGAKSALQAAAAADAIEDARHADALAALG